MYAEDEFVKKEDIGNLSFEDNTFKYAVMSRSLWARDHETQLEEAFRVLDEGGQLILCESFNRWWKDGKNTLLEAVKEAGFEITKEIGTEPKGKDIWQYIVCMKPVEKI